MPLSIVIPTYGRDEVLTDSIAMLLAQVPPAAEIVVVDQTLEHAPATMELLTRWDQAGAIRWIRHQPPGTVGAMNRGLVEARHELVLFLDDDIRPGAGLVGAHVRAHEEYPEAWAVVGQVLQPWDAARKSKDDEAMKRGGDEARDQEELPTEHTDHTEREYYRKDGKCGKEEGKREYVSASVDRASVCPRSQTPDSPSLSRDPRSNLLPGLSDLPVESHPSRDSWAGGLTRDLDFPFNGDRPAWVTNVIGCNFSIRREKALAVGGLDANFTVPVAYRFETEFAKRLVAGGRIRFEPRASIDHLRASRGGTRSQGSHLTSASPVHGVGDYYFALRCGRGWERLRYILRRPFREVRTRFHLRHPWWIPVKLVGELRALALALRLWRRGPRLLSQEDQ